MIIINTPHNPSGQVFSADDLQQLAALTRNTDIVILSDEVYEHVVFDDQPHHGYGDPSATCGAQRDYLVLR